MKTLKPISRIVIAISAMLMIAAYYVPLWQILMWAPQYPEGLEMKIWINTLSGDVKIISALNHYIGMKHIEVNMFPEFQYMVYLLGFMIMIGLTTVLLNKRFMLWAYVIIILMAGVAALVDFYLWGYDYGHNLDPRAPIVVPGMVYQPPIIGTKQLLNFTAFSGPDVGGWIIFVTGLLAMGSIVYEIVLSRRNMMCIGAGMLTLTFVSCSVEPEPLRFWKDACYNCKMILMDKKFGAEIVTGKGKIYKFDDLNCMINFIHSGQEPQENIEHLLAVDFSNPGKLIKAREAFFVRSDKIKSPMASQAAAFETKQSADSHNKEWEGILINWNELVTQFE